MADKKVSELDAITGADTAADDLFLIVDSSGSVTKKITRAELNNAIEQDVLAQVDITSANIDGGTIDNTPIGASTPSTGVFTDLTATGTASIAGVLSNVVEDTTPQLGGNLDLNSNDITGTGNINVTGNVTSDGLRLGDGDYAAFGDGLDLQILHSGTGSFITDAGTGDLHIRADNNLLIQDAGGSTNRVTVNASGINVTGTVTSTVSSGANKLIVQNTAASQQSALQLNTDSTTPGQCQIYMGKTSAPTNGQVGYDPNSDFMYFYTNNSEAARIDSSGNVGIGTSSPSFPLTIENSANHLYLKQSNQDNGWLINTADADGELHFSRRGEGASPSNNERLTISVAGNVGIGTTSPSELLHVDSASGDAAIRIDGSTRSFKIEQNNYGLRFVDVSAGSAERMRLLAGGGLTFNGDTAAANALDDYEEGTKTTSLDASGAGLSITGSGIRYTKIGRFVYVSFDVTYPTTSNTENARITMPFTQNSGAGSVYFSGIVGWSDNSQLVKVHGASNYAYFMKGDSNPANQHLTNADLSGKRLIGDCFMQT